MLSGITLKRYTMDAYITKRLADELPVTTQHISRKYFVPVQEASDALREYATRNSNVCVKYSLCGIEKAGNGRRADILINIVSGDELEKARGRFERVVSEQVFSVAIGHAELSNIIEMSRVSFTYSEDDMSKCRLIQTETSDYEISSTGAGVVQPEEKVPIKRESDKPKEILKDKEPSRPVYTSRKAASTPVVNKKPVYVSRKRKEDVIDKETNVKRSKVDAEEEEKKKKQREELERMIADDDGFSDDDFDGVIVDGGKEEETAEIYTGDDIDVSPEEEEITVHSQDEVDKVKEEPAPPSTSNEYSESKIDAKEVPEVETYTDADGFIVRKVNRNANTVPPPRTPRTHTVELKKPGNTGPKKQANLMSFFKKK